MSTLIAITYEDEQTARQAFDALGRLQKQQLLVMEDVALATKDEKGKVKIKDTLEKQHTGAAGRRRLVHPGGPGHARQSDRRAAAVRRPRGSHFPVRGGRGRAAPGH